MDPKERLCKISSFYKKFFFSITKLHLLHFYICCKKLIFNLHEQTFHNLKTVQKCLTSEFQLSAFTVFLSWVVNNCQAMFRESLLILTSCSLYWLAILAFSRSVCKSWYNLSSFSAGGSPDGCRPDFFFQSPIISAGSGHSFTAFSTKAISSGPVALGGSLDLT